MPKWLGWQDLNLRVRESKSLALPLGYTPVYLFENGAFEEIRTPDPRLRRAMLYPTELQTQIGAGDGNRTHAASLEGWNSTTELHPQRVNITTFELTCQLLK